MGRGVKNLIQNRFFRVALVVAGLPSALILSAGLTGTEPWETALSYAFGWSALILAPTAALVWALSPKT